MPNFKSKPSKYRAKKVYYEGKAFASQKELRVYKDLLLQERAGVIRNIKLQVTFNLIPSIYFNGITSEQQFLFGKQKKCGRCIQKQTSYIADFVYTVVSTGEFVVKDAKGCRNKKSAAYRTFLKKKRQMKIIYNIDVVEA